MLSLFSNMPWNKGVYEEKDRQGAIDDINDAIDSFNNAGDTVTGRLRSWLKRDDAKLEDGEKTDIENAIQNIDVLTKALRKGVLNLNHSFEKRTELADEYQEELEKDMEREHKRQQRKAAREAQRAAANPPPEETSDDSDEPDNVLQFETNEGEDDEPEVAEPEVVEPEIVEPEEAEDAECAEPPSEPEPEPDDGLSKLTKKQLVELCNERNISPRGNRQVLIDRLRAE